MIYEVFAFGSNSSGQLAIGHRNDVATPTKCIFATGVELTSRPVQLAAGGNHTLLRCEDGTVYATGNNRDGRCALSPCEEPLSTFQRVSFVGQAGEVISRFEFVAATWEASVFITLDDKIYVCGSGPHGELGCGIQQKQISQPHLLTGSVVESMTGQIVDVSSSMNHTVILYSSGDMLGLGRGKKGELGPNYSNGMLVRIEHNHSVEKPLQYDRPCKIVCGREFTCFVRSSENGVVSLFGSDKHGVRSSIPEQSLQHWRQVAASWGSIFVLLADNQLVSWGRNDHGQLGSEDLPPLRAIAAGSEHCLGETLENNIVAWGWGEHGNCGLPVDSKGDVRVTCNLIRSGHLLGAGCATSWIYTDERDGQ